MTNQERDKKLKEILKDIKDLGAYEVQPYGIENHLSIDDAISQINQLFSEGKDKDFPYCSNNCATIKELGVGECENVCPLKFAPKDKEVEEAIRIVKEIMYRYCDKIPDDKRDRQALQTLIDFVERKL